MLLALYYLNGKGSHTLLKLKIGDCCVFCSYDSVKYLSTQ